MDLTAEFTNDPFGQYDINPRLRSVFSDKRGGELRGDFITKKVVLMVLDGLDTNAVNLPAISKGWLLTARSLSDFTGFRVSFLLLFLIFCKWLMSQMSTSDPESGSTSNGVLFIVTFSSRSLCGCLSILLTDCGVEDDKDECFDVDCCCEGVYLELFIMLTDLTGLSASQSNDDSETVDSDPEPESDDSPWLVDSLSDSEVSESELVSGASVFRTLRLLWYFDRFLFFSLPL